MCPLCFGERVSRFFRFVPLCLSLAMLGVVGCGGEDSSGTSSSGGSETSSAAKQPDPEPKKDAEPAESQPEEKSPEESTTAAAEKKPDPPAEKKTVDPNAVGSFSGTIVLDGDAPDAAVLVKAGAENVKDKEVCAAADVPDESLVIGEGNGIANVFVYLRRAPKGYESEAPSDPVVLDQKGCTFIPHVSLIRAGQQVLMKSSDAVPHNIHSFPSRNQGVNTLVDANDSKGIELKFPRAETEPVAIKCDIHAWMSSYHLVLDHPFMAVTDADGKFSIEGLPAGDYEFRIWHERGDVLEKAYEVTVTGDDSPVTLKYDIGKFPPKG